MYAENPVAYLRGDYYLWADDGARLHIWVHDGADGWDASGWAADMDGARRTDRMRASGVSIPESVLDEYVMMRIAELIELGNVAPTIDRALRRGNFGGEALAVRADAIKAALRNIR